MTLNANHEKRESEFPSDVAKAVQDRVKLLTPPSSFEYLWHLYQQSNRGNQRAGHLLKSTKRRKWILSLNVVVLCLVFVFGAGMISQTFGATLKKIPFIELLYKHSGGLPNGLEQIDQKNLSTSVNLSATNKDIKFSIVDVFYDGFQIVINYEVDFLNTQTKLTSEDATMNYDYKIEGAHPTMISTHVFTITGDHTFVGTTLIDTATLPDHPEITMSVNQIGNTKGNWKVTVPLSSEKSSRLTTTFHPEISAAYKNITITVNKITFTPVTTQLEIKSKERDLSFKIKDDLETPFEYAGGRGGNGEHFLSFSPVSLINPKPRFLTLVIMDTSGVTVNQKNVYADYTDKFPITMQGYNGGFIKITNVEFLADTTIVYYEASDANNQTPFLMFQDSSGKRYSYNKHPIRLSRDTFSYKLQFPKLDSVSGLKFLMPIDVFEEEPKKPLEIKIPLNWGD
ncbi:DUF4179 domain-containing protein [Paenibacillus sp. V4I7]|uniref:DUF4179 domain-containing protein n=1 Tax=Paenibacillus sp. V4I7 TaxID=3042307 RepID=UPI002780266D|nr:DUF4179 domain-containing protein [Paenibacillus sp. V4I7]MDQ0899902.1 hypothetical protein [Paenibacillus sp. V4I7]